MGLIKALFSQNPATYEQRGDTFFDKDEWGLAKLEYEKASDRLEKASSGYDETVARLQEKLRRAKQALALEHRQTGENLMEVEHYEDALEFFELAITLTEDPELIPAIKNRVQEIESLTAAETQPFTQPRENGEALPNDQEIEHFMALCGPLPEEVQAAYFSYGESFASGYLALNRGEFELAAEYLSHAMKENPSPDSFVPLELGTALLNLEKFDEARRLLEIFLQHHPEALPGYQLLCEVLWEMDAMDQAEALLANCPEELKNSLAYHLLCGETMVQAGNYSGATSFYQDFIKEYGWNESVARALAGAFEALEDFEKARNIYAEIMDQCQSCHARIDPAIKRKFADISFDLGLDTPAILEMYLSLIQEDPGNAEFYFQRISEIYSSLGNEEEARRFRLFAQQTNGGD